MSQEQQSWFQLDDAAFLKTPNMEVTLLKIRLCLKHRVIEFGGNESSRYM